MQPAVLVVGAGPVGLTMAAELARYGVPTRIIDKAPQRTDKSKALVLWSRTLELLDRAGCGQSFVDAGHEVTAANIIAHGHTVAHLRLDEVKSPHPYALMLPQSETERLLNEHLQSYGVRLERPVELLRFTASSDRITATLRHQDGREETLTVPWMVGCDGAHSVVRHGLGMQFEGSTLDTDFILADVHLSGLSARSDEISVFWHSDGILVFFPITPDRYRVIADIGEVHTKERPADPTLAEVQALIDRRGPGGIHISSPVWLACFRINERKVKDYRAGRVFLAGDAAHIHSPAGGQGMNTGMQDAFNLAWKLALVYYNLAAPESLLDSYSIERSAVGQEVLRNADRLTIAAMLRSRLWQEVRDHLASLLFGLAPVRNRIANTMTELSVGYPHSPLTFAGRHGLPGPSPGERAPITDDKGLVGTGSSPRFALFAQADSESAALIQRHHDLLELSVRPPFADNGIWLVRPDEYVALVTRRGNESEVDEYLNKLRGRST